MNNKRQELILKYIRKQKLVSRSKLQSYISKIMSNKNSKITLLRDLNTLIAEGKIKKNGIAKNTVYTCVVPSILETINVTAYFKKDIDKRILKSDYFNFDIWDNLHNLFTNKEKQDLAKFNKQYIKNKKELTPILLKKELERLTIEFSWKSSHIEGNSYSLLDTERLLKENVQAKGKKAEEAIMILNHKKALDFVYTDPAYFKKLSISKIEELHRLLVSGLNVNFGLRKNRAGITGTNYRPIDNIHQIRQSVEQLVKVINRTENPLEKALIAILMISYIQPFEDGNKRSARILGNALLLANNYCPLSYCSVNETNYKKATILFYEQNNATYFKNLFVEQFKQAIKKYF
ncbi:MAG: Fic family protein [Endomicrobium sp.]|jgi:Fic family protein|nr:Fic family protein [Endomicrobium sp.]